MVYQKIGVGFCTKGRLAVPVGAGEGEMAIPTVGFEEEHLVDVAIATGEAVCGPGHVETPDPVTHFFGEGVWLGRRGFRAVGPSGGESFGVVVAETFESRTRNQLVRQFLGSRGGVAIRRRGRHICWRRRGRGLL